MDRIVGAAMFAAFTVMVANSASAKEKAPPPPEPATHPSWGDVKAKAQAMLVSNLFDPSSAQIIYTSGFQWGFTKPLIGKRTHQWVACGTLNAKNRMGGYVGAQAFWIAVDPAGTVSYAMVVDTVSSCDGPGVPLQPELKEGYGTTPVSAGGAALSIADELSKLADLKAKGIISEEEFNAQKAKLLAR